jgi:hypothetical protein
VGHFFWLHESEEKMKPQSADQHFGTDHIYLAGFLTCRGYRVAGTEANSSGRIQFLFRDSMSVRSAVAEFMSGASVPARQFAFEILKLKRLLPQVMRNKYGARKVNKVRKDGGTDYP